MIKDFVRKHPLFTYFGLTYLITWTLSLPLILKAQGVGFATFPDSFYYFTLFGPLFGAVITTFLIFGKVGLKQYLATFVKVNGVIKIAWVAAFSPIIILLLIFLIMAFTSNPLNIADFGIVNFLGDIGVVSALALWIFVNSIGEEGGWRGFALPLLEKKQSPFIAASILAVFWIIWHLPYFFFNPLYMSFTVVLMIFFFIGIYSGSILLAWIYNKSAGSLVPVILWHGFFNFATASKGTTIAVGALFNTLVVVAAVLIIILDRKEFFKKPV